MNLNIYAILDLQAQRAVQPFMRENDAVAVRDFTAACAGGDSPFAKNPDDYVMYHIGTWDDETMRYNEDNEGFNPRRVMTGTEAVIDRAVDQDKIAALNKEIELIKSKMNGQHELNLSPGGTD